MRRWKRQRFRRHPGAEESLACAVGFPAMVRVVWRQQTSVHELLSTRRSWLKAGVAFREPASMPGLWRYADHTRRSPDAQLQPETTGTCCLEPLLFFGGSLNIAWEKVLDLFCISVIRCIVLHAWWKTRCSAIAEKPRCRVLYSFRQK